MKLSKEERAGWNKEQKRHYKKYGVPLKINESTDIAKSNIAVKENYIVLCVRFGYRYGRDYVERLRNMVSRNLTLPYEFVCLTDDKIPIEGVGRYIKIIPVITNNGGTKFTCSTLV